MKVGPNRNDITTLQQQRLTSCCLRMCILEGTGDEYIINKTVRKDVCGWRNG